MTPMLIEGYDAVICDLDGVVYRGGQAVPGAVDALNSLPRPVVYVTNNASTQPSAVAARLRDLGVKREDTSVLTSSMAGAHEMARRVGRGAAVLAVGGEGVRWALQQEGLVVVRPGEATDVDGVLQGYGPRVTAEDLAQAAYAIEAGAQWVVTNDDATLPTNRGVAPGNGTLVAAVATATGTEPEVVVGKPHPPLYLMGTESLGVEARRTVAVGDRLETDIAGAAAAGMESILVLTGVHGLRDAALADPDTKPTYVVAHLGELLEDYPQPRQEGEWWVCRAARVRIRDGAWDREGPSGTDGWTLDAGRAALAALAGMPSDAPTALRRRLADALPAQQ